MKLINLSILRYKNLRDISLEFKGAGLYIASGPNEVGKSSFLESGKSLMRAKELAPEPVTTGEANSITIGEFQDAQGNIAEVIKNIDAKSGKVKFELKYNNMKSSKIGDITDIFKFNDMTAERFIALGASKKGKKEQLDYVLEILPEKDRQEFANLQAKEAEIFNKRTDINRLVKTLQASVKVNTLSEEEESKIALKEKAEQFIEVANKKIAEADKVKQEKENLEKSKKSFKSVIDSLNLESFSIELKTEFESVIKKIEKEYDDKIAGIEIINVENLKVKRDRQKEGLKSIEQFVVKQALKADYQKQLDEALKKQTKLNDDLTIVRETIENFFVDKQFPIPELIVGSLDEGLSVKTKHGILPFDEEQLSTSEIMFITLKIMYFVNKNVDIIYLGRLESFGKRKTQALVQFAKEYDIQIIADKVNEDDDAPFVVEVIFDEGKKETLLEVPLEENQTEPKDIPAKIEKRKKEGKQNDEKKIISQEDENSTLSNEKKKEIEDDILGQETLF